MKHKISKRDELLSTILAALAKLDQKGADEKMTRAMTIVFEAFRMDSARRSFSADDLFASAICR